LSFPAGHLALLSGLLAGAAAWEIRSRRIPNFLTAAVTGTGLLAQFLVHGPLAIASGLASGLIVAIALWAPWLKGFLGGGDLKLAAALAVWTGLALLPSYLLAAAVFGGAVAVVSYVRSNRETRKEVAVNLTHVALTHELPALPAQGHAGRVSVPYGVALAAGAMVVLWGARS
jgi:prepilin peptidase CpaA